ncbi:MAG: class I tRNA ligase family protein [Candidatus Jorgensenbacteria bacterium]
MLFGDEEFSLPKTEEKTLAYWRANDTFNKSVALRKAQGKKHFVFYEGPPTANGRPGIHHVIARAFKDVVLRYKTMRGFYVPRKGGWDTHGLPVEIEVEKALGLKMKKDIERYGIAPFNAKCRESVWKYKDEWERLTERIGFWLDLKHPYITYENSYMESLWGIFKEVWKKKLFYQGHKIVLWCTRCGTGLSSHEVAQGYREVTENSAYLKFKLKPKQKIKDFTTDDHTYILSWTTTPWTLPGTVALAVGKNIEYAVTKKNGETLIVALQSPFGKELGHAGVGMKGGELVGLEYEPLFDVKPLRTKTSHKIYPADFVTTTDGTGVVHIAPMYGEDDYQLGKREDLPQSHTVDEQGNFTKDVSEFAGMYVKSKETEEKILNHLQTTNHLLQTVPYTHDYPFCWRCDTPLLYYARDSWFIAMSKLRDELLKENGRINWVPEHLKEGRFGEWLREVKDWAISRERYWGTPLPIWRCGKCLASPDPAKRDSAYKMVGSVEELEKLQEKRTNRYLLMRHGLAESNITNAVSHWPERVKYHLTLGGRVGIEKLLRRWRWGKVHYIYASDMTRTKETEQMLADAFKGERVHFDPRLREINTGAFEGTDPAEYHTHFSSDLEKFTKRLPDVETLTDVRKRMYEFVRETEAKHEGKTIVVVSHDYPLWMLESAMRGWTDEEAVAAKHARGGDFYRNEEVREVPFRRVPRDETGRMDLHRPYIDEVMFQCGECGGEMRRIPEVADVWFDSGAMPFAAGGTDNSQPTTNDGKNYPADFISEGVDQTRGWFYTLLAIGVLMGKGTPFRNVISLGLVMDKNGQKMSKSKGNVVDPWAMVEKYGADAVRWYCYTVNPPGEPKKFDEADLGKVLRQFILMVYNSLVFYKTYADRRGMGTQMNADNISINQRTNQRASANILDKWILVRLNEVTAAATEMMDAYDVGGAARIIEEFAGDLSRWYIRRSRARFSGSAKGTGAGEDYISASATLHHTLLALSKLIAPFMPFFAEAMYQALANKSNPQSSILNPSSVHLSDWPKANSKLTAKSSKLLEDMAEIRRLASLALAEREKAGIRVRQPIAKLKIKIQNSKIKIDAELLAILKDEVNVKEIVFDGNIKNEVELDTVLTHELLEEGWLRDLTRAVQGLRQDAGCEPKDVVHLYAEVPEELRHVMEKYGDSFRRAVNAKFIEYKKTEHFGAELETKIGEWPVWFAITKQPRP